MADAYIGEIRLFPFNFAPSGWVFCDGRELSINQYQTLFALIGTTYGGNGSTTFCVPDLKGRTPVHAGNGITLGNKDGTEKQPLAVAEMPQHTHQAMGSTQTANSQTAVENFWASASQKPYATAGNKVNTVLALTETGGNQGHQNMQPCLVLNYCIALSGNFPPHSD